MHIAESSTSDNIIEIDIAETIVSRAEVGNVPREKRGMTIIVIGFLRCLTRMTRITSEVKSFLVSGVPCRRNPKG